MKAVRNASAAFQDEIPNYVFRENNVATVTPSGGGVRVFQPLSHWVVQLESRFNELGSLPRGWDGYTGLPVSFNCSYFAKNLIERLCLEGIPAPSLVPGSDGSLQIEWHRNDFDVEIHVLAPRHVRATRFNQSTGVEEELELDSDFRALESWVSDLKSQKSNQMEAGV